MKGKLNSLDKKPIIDLKTFVKHIINYSIGNKYDLSRKADNISRELDTKINDFLCKFAQNL